MNELETIATVSVEDIKIILQLLAPFAPHMTEQLWGDLGETESIHLSEWPKCDENLIEDDEITVVVQVGGKIRVELLVSKDIEEKAIIDMALNHTKILPWIEGKEIKKTIYIKGKLVSIVI